METRAPGPQSAWPHRGTRRSTGGERSVTALLRPVAAGSLCGKRGELQRDTPVELVQAIELRPFVRAELTGDVGGLQQRLGAPDILALDAALERLARMDPDLARVVELRFFAGLSVEETARVLAWSTATVTRSWRVARMWLLRELGPQGDAHD